MLIIDGIPVFGAPDEGALKQIKLAKEKAQGAALMADHHLGYAVPIGGVVAYKNRVSPSGVGFDIACGNKAVRLDTPASEIKAKMSTIMDEVVKRVSFGVGQKNNVRVPHALFDDDPAWAIPEIGKLKSLAKDQLGTVGSGNHYVDIFEDENGATWVGVHFGSRGLGHKTATHFLAASGGKDGMHVEPAVIDADSDLGEQYLLAMHLCGRYAYAGRDWVCATVADIIGGKIEEEIHNHHNFAWHESHGGEDYWIVRKGATPAFPNQKGFVGGTMGENSVILEGKESSEGALTYYSTVHGAGRVLGRREAIGRFIKDENGKKQRQAGKVRHEDWVAWMKKSGVTLRGAGLDEAPQCYKRLPEVLAEHSASINILHTLKPLGVAMAGANEIDPYKD